MCARPPTRAHRRVHLYRRRRCRYSTIWEGSVTLETFSRIRPRSGIINRKISDRRKIRRLIGVLTETPAEPKERPRKFSGPRGINVVNLMMTFNMTVARTKTDRLVGSRHSSSPRNTSRMRTIDSNSGHESSSRGDPDERAPALRGTKENLSVTSNRNVACDLNEVSLESRNSEGCEVTERPGRELSRSFPLIRGSPRLFPRNLETRGFGRRKGGGREVVPTVRLGFPP